MRIDDLLDELQRATKMLPGASPLFIARARRNIYDHIRNEKRNAVLKALRPKPNIRQAIIDDATEAIRMFNAESPTEQRDAADIATELVADIIKALKKASR